MSPRPLALLLPLLAACLEQTTGEKKALPEAYLEQIQEGGEEAKIAGAGPTVKVTGFAKGVDGIPVDIDIALPDPATPGGMARLGKVVIDTPGPYELALPQGKEVIHLAFFQDMDGDGPDGDDTYVKVDVQTAAEDITGLDVELVQGAYSGPGPVPGGGGEHVEAAPGAPGGGGGPPGGEGPPDGQGAPDGAVVPDGAVTPGGEAVGQHVDVPHGAGIPTQAQADGAAVERLPVGAQPFGALDGPKVTLRGVVTGDRALPVELDIRLSIDGTAHEGLLRMDGPGPFELLVPRRAGAVVLAARQDLAGDGPSALDPVSAAEVQVGEVDVDAVALALAVAGLAAGAAADPGPTADAPAHQDVVHREVAPGEAGGEGQAHGAVLVGPFDDHPGPLITLSGDVEANPGVPIDLDLRTPDPDSAAGVKDLGKLILAAPGPFSVKVPRGFGELIVEGFQDPGDDGPDATDPWGSRTVEIADQDLAGVHLVLVAGARGTGAEHHEVPHSEAAAGQQQSVDLSAVGKPVSAGGVGPFANHRGSFVKVRGQVRAAAEMPVDIDVWVEDPAAPGGMRNQGKLVLVRPSEFVLRVPQGAGRLALEGYQDADVDGPTEADPFARIELTVGAGDPDPVTLSLVATGAAARGGDAAAGAPPPAAGPPFATYDGPTVTLAGVVRSEHAGAVDIDIRVPDAAAPGGMRQEGKLRLEGPGVFELAVPRGHGAIELEAFQDRDANGPDDTDPYGRLGLEVGERDLQAAIDLVDGGRALAAAQGAAPGAGGAAGPGQGDPFPSYKGERVQIRGTLRYAGEHLVDLDLFKIDPASPGGRSIAGKLKVKPGEYSFAAPRDFGQMEIEAFVDIDGDGPSANDPVGRYADNPLTVGSDDLSGIDIEIEGG